MEPEVIQHGSEKYAQACELREIILRKPLKLRLLDEDLRSESEYHHYGIWDGEMIAACLVAVPHTDALVQIRQMAVAECHQSKGIGKKLIQFAEQELRTKGFTQVFLHARKEAVLFYRKLGYQSAGSEFIEISIPHLKMEKNLP